MIVVLALLVSTLMLREVWCWFRWRRNVDHIDRGEWTRTVRALRDRGSQPPPNWR